MRTKLSLLMLALLPLASFGQNAQSKISTKPVTQKPVIAPGSAQNLSYAPAAYCMPVLDCTDGDLITNVNFAGINNTTTCSTNGYGDFTAMTTTTPILAGMSYPVAVTVFNGTWPYEAVSVWVDYNKNDLFEASEFAYLGNKFTAGTVISGNLTIPAATANGNYKMRVRVAAVGDATATGDLACDEAQGYGETEDYTIAVGAAAPTGCLTAPNGQYPAAAFVPVCNGSATAITTAGWAGEYSVVTVTTGTSYTFSLSNAAYFITIADATGTTVLGSGTGSLTWTSTLSGNVRFYAHTDSACGSGTSATVHSRSVKCGTVPTEPDYGCDQNYTGVADLASNITKSLNYALANDFFVPMESAQYKMQSITASMVPLATTGGADIASFDIVLMSDSGTNTPGAVVKTWTGVVPVSVTALPDTFAGYPTFAVKLDLANYELPVNAAADTRYWLSLQATSASATSIYWIGYKYTEGYVTASNYGSTDNGATYTQVIYAPAPGQHYDSIWSIDAECASAAVSESGNKNVSFYPNPVKDILTINSKKTIETVHVYNIAGQKMPVSTKIVNGKVDMSKLAPGVYIISTILDGGINESFKVIKK